MWAKSRGGPPSPSSLKVLQVTSFSELLGDGDESVSNTDTVPTEEGSRSDPSLSLPSKT